MFNTKIINVIIGMKLCSYFKKGRAVSPVIATILLITASLAAGAILVTILSNIEERSPTLDIDTSLGNSGSSSKDFLINTEVTKLSGDIELQIQNITDYTKLTITLSFTGNIDFIYIIDFDILVFGVKLDDFSSWEIKNSIGASYTSFNGQYAGYKQGKMLPVQYFIEIEDRDRAIARIPDKTTFSYEVKIGTEPGIISKTVIKERESKVIFNFVSYNVAIFHWGSNFGFNKAASHLEETLNSVNGTSKLFFLYTRGIDAYDISNQFVLDNMNVTFIIEKYQVIMIDKWLVPVGAGNLLNNIHNNGTNLMFYGSIEEFDPNNEDFNTVISNIDYSATKNITGLIPDVYTGTKPKGTANSYTFFSAVDGALAGISGEEFSEIPNKQNKIKGDRRGFDVADFTDEIDKFDVLGNATYQFYSEDKPNKIIPANLIWSSSGPLFIRKNGIINGSGDVYSFIWKHHENIDDRKATKIDTSHLSLVRKNMLLSLVSELERQTFSYAELTIDSLILYIKDNKNKKFDFEIVATVTNADINAGTLIFSVDMPFNFDWKKTDYKYNFYVDGSKKISKQAIMVDTSGTNDVLVFDIGSNYLGLIPKNSVIAVTITEKLSDKKWMELNKSNTNFGDWDISAIFESGLFVLTDEATYTLNTAIDDNIWP